MTTDVFDIGDPTRPARLLLHAGLFSPDELSPNLTKFGTQPDYLMPLRVANRLQIVDAALDSLAELKIVESEVKNAFGTKEGKTIFDSAKADVSELRNASWSHSRLPMPGDYVQGDSGIRRISPKAVVHPASEEPLLAIASKLEDKLGKLFYLSMMDQNTGRLQRIPSGLAGVKYPLAELVIGQMVFGQVPEGHSWLNAHEFALNNQEIRPVSLSFLDNDRVTNAEILSALESRNFGYLKPEVKLSRADALRLIDTYGLNKFIVSGLNQRHIIYQPLSIPLMIASARAVMRK